MIKASHWLNTRGSRLLRFVQHTSLKERCTLILSGETLRLGLFGERGNPGIKLAKFVSWERTLEDFDRSLRSGDLRAVRDIKYIAVRLGLSGAFLWSRQNKARDDCVGTLDLWYDKELIEEEYADPSHLGSLAGLTTVFLASIVRELHQVRWDGALDDALNLGVQKGIRACRRFYDVGYGPVPRTIRYFERLQLPIVQIFGELPVGPQIEFEPPNLDVFRRRFRESYAEGETNLFEKKWSILGERLWPDVDTVEKEDAKTREDRRVAVARKALNIGRSIVRDGAESALRQQRFPYRRFGSLISVERSEIEGLRSIRNLLTEYLGRGDTNSPVSIAVFGPPGSGKSYGVKQIATRIVGAQRIMEFAFNLAQFSSFDQLAIQLLKVRDAGLEDRIPLVFFDEFDCTLDDQPLGWLKYFLSPMQDGRFQHGDSMLGIGKAILVFAGGIATTHAEFTDSEFWGDTASTNNSEVFRDAKGPDFHSRLRGYMDIGGVNPILMTKTLKSADRRSPKDDVPSDDFNDSEDFSYVIRRAVVIRQLLENRAHSQPQLLDVNDRLDVDQDVLDAMLTTMRYKHGIRSIESIVDMSLLTGHRQFSKSALPAAKQFFMHVDPTFRRILLRQYDGLNSVLSLALKDSVPGPEGTPTARLR